MFYKIISLQAAWHPNMPDKLSVEAQLSTYVERMACDRTFGDQQCIIAVCNLYAPGIHYYLYADIWNRYDVDTVTLEHNGVHAVAFNQSGRPTQGVVLLAHLPEGHGEHFMYTTPFGK